MNSYRFGTPDYIYGIDLPFFPSSYFPAGNTFPAFNSRRETGNNFPWENSKSGSVRGYQGVRKPYFEPFLPIF